MGVPFQKMREDIRERLHGQTISAVKLSEGEWCPDRGARVGALAFDHLEISSALWSATMTALATAGLLAGQ
jgi:hypothetical protein